ncbi:hypothetical protein FIV06_07030 [Labrenzia sp. THAF191b]|jgi:hypothetical protein|uniref:hypothetical protein n=1 Tax=Stappiaceae TaxID=2821832 RepID=UPI001267C7DC|nr:MULTISPECIES: hypothetical protein [Stappiaceae]MBO9421668.1 hypothetical protein [Labrenzia sp. R4_2]QFS97167.1 hypothetical protein FIV06_07030 [Labrenzia sp. THAF191b]QFT03482.1 hypothetical protein FIV05_07030 [Labrenzia sp. THAF191a]QFT15024.1 hypothetical protein FIV03_07035 [Labrenzia sp. THAF187b]QFT66487.1 hypothetical protein FIU93_06840 [Labrenzia sp. THAF35]
MTLILLAISLSVTLCVLAFNFAIYALPVMAGISAFQFVHAAGAGFGPSALAALGGAAFSVGLVIAILGFARNPFLRLVALGVFAAPAAVAGYALAHGLAKNALESEIALNLLCGTCGLIVAVAAMTNLSALGEDVLSR